MVFTTQVILLFCCFLVMMVQQTLGIVEMDNALFESFMRQNHAIIRSSLTCYSHASFNITQTTKQSHPLVVDCYQIIGSKYTLDTLMVISLPGSFSTNQLASKRPSRHQAKSTPHQTQIKMINQSTVCRGELAVQTNFFSCLYTNYNVNMLLVK